MNARKLVPVFMAVLILQVLACFGLDVDYARSCLEFTLDNASLVYLEGLPYLSLDLMASSQDPDRKLGTGIVYLNYNPQVFGEYLTMSGNVIVERGTLLNSSPLSIYSLILNDNTPTRLAITYEYLYGPGAGNILGSEPQSLLNIRFKVLNPSFSSGLSFADNLMQTEQYLDDNATLFNPVTASDVENSIVPTRPEAVALSIDGNMLSLSWQECPGCSYTVYSSDVPVAEDWQIEATNLSTPSWSSALEQSRMFFRVKATGLPGR